METLIADLETDNLLDEMTRIWTLQVGSETGDDVTVYADQPGYEPISVGMARLREAGAVVFHNGIGFDWHVVNRFYPGTLPPQKVIDTLVLARLAYPDEREHSLEVWGNRLKILKGKYTGDFSKFDDELVTYARQDIVVTRALYAKLKAYTEGWGESVALEHRVAWAINAQERNGFLFDTRAAEELYAVLRDEQVIIEAKLQIAFPPIERTEVFIPKVNNKARGYVKGEAFTKRRTEAFNPGSRKHIAERLESLGWKPKVYGDNGIPTVDEKTLSGLAFPEVAPLLEYLRLQKMIGQLAEGKGAWLKAVKADGRIHGRVNPNGACTGRMSHFGPNVAQADKDPRMRALWIVRRGYRLVGCDAEGLEARMLGHYLHRYDGGSFTEMVVNGDKSKGTDVHSANRDAVRSAGYMIDRDGAKTLLYALMYGAGDAKLGATIKENLRAQGLDRPKVPNKELGKLVRRALAKSMKGIDKLVGDIKAAVKRRGYIIGLDGRHIPVRSEHSALNTLLQGGGAIVMKKALVLFVDEFCANWFPEPEGDWGLCANVHDEVQMEVRDQNGLPAAFGEAFADCIRDAGTALKVRCPLAGAYEVGDNWSQTH